MGSNTDSVVGREMSRFSGPGGRNKIRSLQQRTKIVLRQVQKVSDLNDYYMNDNTNSDNMDTTNNNDSVAVIRKCEFIPCRIKLNNICQQFPNTLLRKLFSSVPKRDYALHNITFELYSCDFLLLRGRSSSGKSSIIKIIAGTEKPTSGEFIIESVSRNSRPKKGTNTLLVQEPRNEIVAQPVYVSEKPKYYEDSKAIYTVLYETVMKIIVPSSFQQKNDTNDRRMNRNTNNNYVIQSIIYSICNNIMNGNDGKDNNTHFFLDKKISQLSISENYILQVIIASLQSVIPHTRIVETFDTNNKDIQTVWEAKVSGNENSGTMPASSSNDNNDGDTKNSKKHTTIDVYLPSPILLLDEWMDNETRDIVQRVQKEALLPLLSLSTFQLVNGNENIPTATNRIDDDRGSSTISSSSSRSRMAGKADNDKIDSNINLVAELSDTLGAGAIIISITHKPQLWYGGDDNSSTNAQQEQSSLIQSSKTTSFSIGNARMKDMFLNAGEILSFSE